MKVALIGYGKMGKGHRRKSSLNQREHEVVARFDREGINKNRSNQQGCRRGY